MVKWWKSQFIKRNKMEAREIKDLLNKMVKENVSSLGFVEQKSSEENNFLKMTDYGYNEISPLIWYYGDLYYVSIGASIRINELNNFLNPFLNISESSFVSNSTITAGIKDFGLSQDGRLKVESIDELVGALKELKSVLKIDVLTFFDSIKSVSDLDKELNRESRPKDLYCSEKSKRPFIGIASAFLNNNPRLEYWNNYYRNELMDVNQYLKIQFENLSKYIMGNSFKSINTAINT